jgi:hypothetical protein
MIAEPINDVECLSKVTDLAAESLENEDVRNIATRFMSTRDLAAWIRSLPQRNDLGDPGDGPKVACDVPQRVRIPAEDPNCVERAAIYLAAGELIDPTAVRQLATIDTPFGRHTFPVEDDRPVKLDPRIPRNALEAGLFRMMDPHELELSPGETLQWVGRVASEPATRYRNGRARIRNARRALYALSLGRPVRRNAIEDVGFALAVAEQTAQMFGAKGLELVRMGRLALEHATRPRNRAPRNLSIRFGGVRVAPDFGALSSLVRVGSRIGVKVGGAALQAKLAQLGLGRKVLAELEKELNREGMTLGAVAAPKPQPGTLAALTTQALTGRG